MWSFTKKKQNYFPLSQKCMHFENTHIKAFLRYLFFIHTFIHKEKLLQQKLYRTPKTVYLAMCVQPPAKCSA